MEARMPTKDLLLLTVLLACLPLTAACSRDDAATTPIAHEVWVLDQSDSPGLAHGGAIYVFDSDELVRNGSAATARRHIDLGTATTRLCIERTGEAPVRPHMIQFNEDHTHVILAFVASGHTVFMDVESGEPLDCLRATRSSSGQQAHAAYPTPDGRFVLVANQNGKRLERIAVDYTSNRFVADSIALLDLATCTTPAGDPCEAPHLRPDNAPVCPFMSAGGLAFVTLRGGGLLVVDVRDTPMRIVAEYDSAMVKGNGCGGVDVRGHMYVNAGGRPGVLHHMEVYGFEVYRFPLDRFDDRAGPLGRNFPAPQVLWTSHGEHDSHGMVATPDGSYVWVLDRHGDTAETFETGEGRHVGTVTLNGDLTDNAAPDIAAISPDGRRIYVALRGPTPLSGDPHNATGSTPGLGVIELADGGRTGRLSAVVRIRNEWQGTDRADPHAVAVRIPR
jgi:hypothetical protein